VSSPNNELDSIPCRSSCVEEDDAVIRVDTDEPGKSSEAMVSLDSGSTGEAAHDSAPNSVRAMDSNGASGAIISGKWLSLRDDMSRRLTSSFIYPLVHPRTGRYEKEQSGHPTRENIHDGPLSKE